MTECEITKDLTKLWIAVSMLVVVAIISLIRVIQIDLRAMKLESQVQELNRVFGGSLTNTP